MFFIKFGTCLAIITLNFLSSPFFSKTPMWGYVGWCPNRSVMFYFSSFFSFCFTNYIISVALYSSLLILLPTHMCCWASLVTFSYQLLYLSTPEFLFGLLKITSISLLIFSIKRDISLIQSFSSLEMVSFSFLNIFKIAD